MKVNASKTKRPRRKWLYDCRLFRCDCGREVLAQGEYLMTTSEVNMDTIADIILKEGVKICDKTGLDREIKEMQAEYTGNLKNKFKDGVNGLKERMTEVLSKYPDVTRGQLHSAILTVTANPAACGKEVSYVVLRYTGASWLCRSVGSLMNMQDELILKDSPKWFPVQ